MYEPADLLGHVQFVAINEKTLIANMFSQDQYGYDGKQLHHCARLAEFIIRYVQGTPLKECYLSKQKDKLMRFKKQLNEDGLPLSCKDAIVLCDFYRETVYSIAHENLTPEDEYVNEARIILKELQCNIMKERIREELLDGRGNNNTKV